MAWKETYERLAGLDAVSPLDPPQLLELAMAAYLTGKESESLSTLIRAHQGFAHCGDFRQAGGIAARIASIAMNTGELASFSSTQPTSNTRTTLG